MALSHVARSKRRSRSGLTFWTPLCGANENSFCPDEFFFADHEYRKPGYFGSCRRCAGIVAKAAFGLLFDGDR